jgi:AAA ATPase domain
LVQVREVCPPFVGRGELLDQVAQVEQRAGHEHAPAAVLVTGEPGSGKTRFLAEVLQRSRLRHARLNGFEPPQNSPTRRCSRPGTHAGRPAGSRVKAEDVAQGPHERSEP